MNSNKDNQDISAQMKQPLIQFPNAQNLDTNPNQYPNLQIQQPNDVQIQQMQTQNNNFLTAQPDDQPIKAQSYQSAQIDDQQQKIIGKQYGYEKKANAIGQRWKHDIEELGDRFYNNHKSTFDNIKNSMNKVGNNFNEFLQKINKKVNLFSKQ